MSMPDVLFSCTRCDFSASDSVCWGGFYYETPNGRGTLIRTLGWCSACASLAPIEVIGPPDDAAVAALARAVKDQEASLSEHVARLRQQMPWYWRLIRTQPPLTPDVERLRYDAEASRQELNHLRVRAEVLAARRSPPRCLECGSHECFPIASDIRPTGSPSQPGPPVKMGMRHPGCGGDLMVRHSGERVHVVLADRYYDTEGRLLRAVSRRLSRTRRRRFLGIF